MKLYFHCVGLDKDKNVSFPTVEGECSPSGPGDELGSLSPTREFDDGTEVTVSTISINFFLEWLLLSAKVMGLYWLPLT